MRTIQILLLLLLLSLGVNAQVSVEYASQRLSQINKIFDTAYFLRFNVQYIYSTDTVYGRFEHSERSGEYVIKGNNFYYKLGDVEYMQNDSFAFNVFHGDKTMILSKRNFAGASSTMPMKQIYDSILQQYANYYTINSSINEIDDEETIEFSTDSIGVPYKRFSITFDRSNYYPIKAEFRYNEVEGDLDSEDTTANPEHQNISWNKTMTILFSQFRLMETDSGIFREEIYVYYDPVKKRFIPSEAFKSFVLYVNGIEQDELEENPEIKEQ
jgi:hypothetical protein